MKKTAVITITALLFVGSVFAASAFTSAELTREANIQVEADTDGIITLSPGENVDAVDINEDGVLEINAAPDGVGLNVEGTFTFGDNATAHEGDDAFSITNADDTERTLSLEYNNVVENEGVTDAVTFTVYDSDGNELDSADMETGASVTLGAGEEVFVVIDTDTTGLSPNADLSGDLVITA